MIEQSKSYQLGYDDAVNNCSSCASCASSCASDGGSNNLINSPKTIVPSQSGNKDNN
jgi:heterodisulfide reductase subunit C